MAETSILPAPAATAGLSDAERFFFDTNGYLVLENFLTPDHVARLLAATDRAIVRRRELIRSGQPQTGFTQTKSEKSTRFFYILDEDPLFLELLDWPALLPYVHGLLATKMPHHHGSDAIVEHGGDFMNRQGEWHIDGHDNGYRNLGSPIPLLQLKVGYYLSDMTEPWQGNLAVLPGSHHARLEPSAADRQRRDFFPGVKQVCAPAGTAILFHNALWHTAAPYSGPERGRKMLYYAYEHPWMVGSQEHWGYAPDFYNRRLSPAQRKFFHGFVFNPPEARWG
jgi:ectoine hydroxylase-related dioxygenase (phytanoyl-CoA dioxygenase family)